MTLPNIHNFLVTDSKDLDVDEMLDKELKRKIFKRSMNSKKIQKNKVKI
jgi:hypothetical protein